MQHVEFFHTDHFENNYFRVPPPAALSHFIDFFWETRFDSLWTKHPKGFSDAQFPNIGYTYIINLGTPFIMQVGEKKFNLKTDGFLPRHNAIECFHKPGNHLFGIKFRISPIIYETKVDFSEYSGGMYPLSYLLKQSIIDRAKKAKSFEERIGILSKYFISLLTKHENSLEKVNVVTQIIDHCFQKNDFNFSLAKMAQKHGVSLRTLQRYFETCTGINTKQAIQVMRIRKAVAHLATAPENFDHKLYGYYDYSHFYRHLKKFLQKDTLKNIQERLRLRDAVR